MNKTFLFTILLIFTISLGGPAFSQDTVLSKVKTGNGFHSTDFRISDGILTVYLPSDMTVNETASGTMILKGSSDPNGFNQIMSKYNLVVEGQNVDITGNNFTLQVPVNLPTGVLGVSLQDKQARILKRAFFPVRLTKRSQLPVNADSKGNFRTPLTSRAGMPAIIEGPFDGNFQTSFISISGHSATILTESTRQLVFLIPDGVQGQKVLSLREGTTDFKTPFTILYVVKVGQDDPARIAGKANTSSVNKAGDQGVLIESEQEMGEIDLEYNPDLGNTGQEKLNPDSSRRELAATGEPSLGPSIGDLSKPLELDPKELEKYSASSQVTSYSENELTSLKQVSDTETVKPKTGDIPGEKPVAAAVPVKGSADSDYDDIKEVKTLLDKQMKSPFTPQEKTDSTSAEDTLTAKNTQDTKKTSEKSEEPVKPVAAGEETKPAVTENSDTAEPQVPEIAAVKTDDKVQEPELKSEAVKEEPVRDASDYSSKMEVKGEKPEEDTNKEEISKTTAATTTAKTNSGNKYVKINDLSSLNTSYGSYQNLDKNIKAPGGEKTGENEEEQIKEENYVSLQDKETVKPDVKTKAAKGKFAIQLASFKEEKEASSLVGKLKAGGYDVYYKRYNVPGKGYWYRVRKGGFSTRKEAEDYKNGLNLSKYHISSFFVVPED